MFNKNIDKISGVKADMAKIRAKQHQEFRSELTEEQLIKFDTMKGKMRHNLNGETEWKDGILMKEEEIPNELF